MKERVLQQIIQYRKFFAVVVRHYFSCQLKKDKINKLREMVFYKAFLSELADTMKSEEQHEFYLVLKSFAHGYIADLDIFLEHHPAALEYLGKQLCSEKVYVKEKISAWETQKSAACPLTHSVKLFTYSSHLISAAKNNDLMTLVLFEDEVSRYDAEIKAAEYQLAKIANRRKVAPDEVVEAFKNDLKKLENKDETIQKFLKSQIELCKNALRRIELNNRRKNRCFALMCWADKLENTALHYAAINNHDEFIYRMIALFSNMPVQLNKFNLTFADILFDANYFSVLLPTYDEQDLENIKNLQTIFGRFLSDDRCRVFYQLCAFHRERLELLVKKKQNEFESLHQVLEEYVSRRNGCNGIDEIQALNDEYLPKFSAVLNRFTEKKLFIALEHVGRAVPEYKEFIQTRKRMCALDYQATLKECRLSERRLAEARRGERAEVSKVAASRLTM